MLKALIKGTENDIVVFGLTECNIKKLKEKRPIHASGKDLNLGLEFYIFYERTQTDLLDALSAIMPGDPQ